ncbi:CapA family protein [Rhizohabitans arisaemae]|uniref:CapA family protein n=1 Tax=Rhizohabitans arisaemae TaxID=2720610 RepID=UPI0024B11FBA|nr:CapA family protein [Rhizohabitans arisaemae]
MKQDIDQGTAARSALRLGAVGDILVDRDEPHTAFARSTAVLDDVDVLFGNCEAVYADGVHPAPSASIPVLGKPEHGRDLGKAGFDVMSLANNHTVDGGYEGLRQTLRLLHDQDIVTCGGGENRAQAVAPAVIERNGWRIAFLAYTCVYPAGYEAGTDTPGLAVLRTHDIYVRSEMDAFQSGGAPERLTVLDPRDLRTLRSHIADARRTADVVVVSVHAGDGSRPAVVLDYERDIARAAIDAGADAYLGHHHHMLRGAEYYRGKPVFYGLGHFVFDVPDFESQVPPSILARMAEHAGEYGYGYRDDGYPLLPMHPEARMTVFAVCDFDPDGTVHAGVVATRLNPEGQPVPLDPAGEDGAVVLGYLRDITGRAELSADWRVGDRTVGGYRVIDLVESVS